MTFSRFIIITVCDIFSFPFYTHIFLCVYEIGVLVFSIELDEYLQKGVNILTSYINELRTFMIKFPWKLTDAIDEYDVNENVPKVKESNIWEKLSIEVNMSNYHFFYLPDSEDLRKQQKKPNLDFVHSD